MAPSILQNIAAIKLAITKVAIILALILSALPVQAQIYVDASAAGANNGTSWADAFTGLQDALAAATGNDQIWIAEGTYKPGANRGDSFTVTGAQDGLEIYGGFNGTETMLSERDAAAHPAVLSGDIGAPSDDTDNSYHVLYFDGSLAGGIITNATVLDGVTVTGGNADVPGTVPDDRGGGLLCDGLGTGSECSPVIRNVIFTGNSAIAYGGVISNSGASNGASNPQIINTIFTGNSAFSGGAIYNSGFSSHPTITNSTFTGNSAIEGGAIHNFDVSPAITNSTFTSNNATNTGGAIANVVGSPAITNSILYSNSAPNGAEIYNSPSPVTSTTTISYSLIEGGVNGRRRRTQH